MRIIPWSNPRRVFELRRHVLSSDNPILWKSGLEYRPFPEKEYIVLTTSTGEVFATLGDSGFHFSGIYNQSRRRVKFNMLDGKITPLTTGEINDSPVGPRRFLEPNFRAVHVNDVNRNLP